MAIRCFRAWLFAAGLLCASVGQAGAQVQVLPPEPVTASALDSLDPLGEPSHWQFTGNAAFPAADLRKILWWNLDVQYALTPGGSRENLAAAMLEGIKHHYQAGGYLDVQVSSVQKPQAIELTIREGPLFRTGKLEIVVPPGFDRKLLTEAQPPTSGQFRATIDPQQKVVTVIRGNVPPKIQGWQDGDNMGELWLGTLEQTAQAKLAESGYFWAQVHAEIVRQPDAMADLRITVTRAGPQAKLGTLTVQGIKKNTEQQLRKLTGLSPGQLLTGSILARAQQRLWDCGRFDQHDVAGQIGTPENGLVDLTLSLTELPDVPSLGEPLSEVDTAALRLRDWLSVPGGRELSAELGKEGIALNVTVIVAPGPGLLLRVRGPQNVQGGMVMTPGQFLLFAGDQRFLTPWRDDLHTRLSIELAPKRIGFGAGVGTGDSFPTMLDLRLAPAAFLQAVHDPKNNAAIRDGTLTITSPTATVRADAATGRLLTLDISDSMRIQPMENAFAREAQLLLDDATRVNAYSSTAPAASFLRFTAPLAIRALGAGTAEQRRLAEQATAKIFSDQAFAGIQENIQELFSSMPKIKSISRSWMSSPSSQAAFFVVPIGSQAFPRGSWPWTISRQVGFTMAGRPEQVAPELLRIYESPETGPLGFLAAAEFLQLGGNARGARMFAERGLDRLDSDAFVRDCRSLCPPGSMQARTLASLVRNLAQLDEAELEALSAAWPTLGPAALRKIRAQIPAAMDADIQDVVRDFQRNLWENALREMVKSRLAQLMMPPARVSAPHAAEPMALR